MLDKHSLNEISVYLNKKNFFFAIAHIRGEIWMHISGGFNQLDKAPLLYQNLLNEHYDIDIGMYLYNIPVAYNYLA